jgi:hypothetical protein
MATKTGSRDFKREAEVRKEQIDKLIDAYDSGQYRSGPSVIDVMCFRGEIDFAMEGPDGKLHYRGRILNPVKKRTPSVERHNAANQADLERWIKGRP